MLTHDDVVTRVNEVLRWQVANGVLHVRSHVDTTDPSPSWRSTLWSRSARRCATL